MLYAGYPGKHLSSPSCGWGTEATLKHFYLFFKRIISFIFIRFVEMGTSTVILFSDEYKSPVYHANPDNTQVLIFCLVTGWLRSSSLSRSKSHTICAIVIWLFFLGGGTNFVSMLVIETILIFLVIFTLSFQKCVQNHAFNVSL